MDGNTGSVARERLRVYTHNIYNREGDWDRRRPVLVKGVRELRPDLIALQEVTVDEDYDQARDLLGDDFEIVHSRTLETVGWNLSVASRWPIGSVRELELMVTPRAMGGALIAEIEAPAPFGPLLFVNHLPDYKPNHEHERERQTVIVARVIEDMVAGRPAHVILAGDLDAEPDAASTRFLAGKQSLEGLSVCYRNAWDSANPEEPGHTFTSRNPLVAEKNWDWPFQRIDHIFVRCGEKGQPTLAIASCELAFAEPVGGVWASDHFGLVADLTPPRLGVTMP